MKNVCKSGIITVKKKRKTSCFISIIKSQGLINVQENSSNKTRMSDLSCYSCLPFSVFITVPNLGTCTQKLANARGEK